MLYNQIDRIKYLIYILCLFYSIKLRNLFNFKVKIKRVN